MTDPLKTWKDEVMRLAADACFQYHAQDHSRPLLPDLTALRTHLDTPPSPPAQAPEGWKLVPVVATDEMWAPACVWLLETPSHTSCHATKQDAEDYRDSNYLGGPLCEISSMPVLGATPPAPGAQEPAAPPSADSKDAVVEALALAHDALEAVQLHHSTTSLPLAIERFGSREACAEFGQQTWSYDVPHAISEARDALAAIDAAMSPQEAK